MRRIPAAECKSGYAPKEDLLRRSKTGTGKGHNWDAVERDVFLDDLDLSREWLEMFPEPPDFDRKRVVEIGCGYGALSVVTARSGARSVLAVEADVPRADAACRIVSSEYPDMNGKIEFVDYSELETPGYDEQFDVVLSQNSFEHYEEPEEVLRRMVKILRPGGTIYTGFGPLWHSPFGSHLKEISPIPWAHLWAGDYLVRAHNRARPHDPRATWSSLGLNRASYRRYREMFNNLSDCEVIHFLENRSIWTKHRLVYFLIEPFRLIPLLREYLTVSLFIVARKRE